MTQQTIAERHKGLWNGRPVSFKKVWGGHEFTEDECARLLAGEEIEFEAKGKTGNTYTAKGALAEQEYNGNVFVGFKPDFGPKKDASGRELPPESWCGVTFTPEQIEQLAEGQTIFIEGFVSSKTGKEFDANITFKVDDDPSKSNGAVDESHKRIVPTFG